MRSWVDVSERRLIGNLRVLQRELALGAARDPALLAVVKANAYGHGAQVCAVALARAGVEWLGVTDAEEGVAVGQACQAADVARPGVLVMSGLAEEDSAEVVRAGLTAVVWSVRQLEWLERSASEPGRAARVHIEVDTGMGRQGCRPGAELEAVLAWLAARAAVRINGIFTHFASTEVAGSAHTVEQRRRFETAMKQVAAAGIRPCWVHAGNSSTIDNAAGGEVAWVQRMAGAVGARAMVRSGLALYGYCLPIHTEAGGMGDRSGKVAGQLQRVMTWKTRVMALRELEAGATVGYNGTFVAERAMRLAILPVGYADGLRRELSATNARAGGWVMMRGRRAAMVGRVSMNLTMVDVSAIDDVQVGDEVVLLGDGVTAEDHARLARTVAYEILCGVRAG